MGFLLPEMNTLLTPVAVCFHQVTVDQMSFAHLCQEMHHDHTQHCDVVLRQNCQ